MVNAQVGIGAGWAGETALIRLKGEVVKHAESVVLPLLLPDSPVAIWWPTDAPEDPADDPLGRLATRRVTDAAAVTRGKKVAMHRQCATYASGNTDLAWTRITAWRALLAASLDQHPLKVQRASVTAERDQPQRRPSGGLADRPAQGAGRAARLLGSRHHRGGDGDQGGADQDQPRRRPAGHVLLPRPARPAGRSASAASCPSCSPRSCVGSTRTTSTPRRPLSWSKLEARS